MKKNIWLAIPMFMTLLTACGAKESTPTLDPAGTFTAVANTIIAGQPTATQVLTETPQPTSAATATLFPTVQSAPAVTNVVSYVYSSSTTSTDCDDASYVSDVTISDGTEIYPGESFTKTWKIYNAGSCTWDTDYALTFVSGEDMDGEDTYLDEEVSPGETVSISVSMVAPTTEASYTGYWRMANDDGDLFGDTIYVNIVVTDDASTLTPTSTPTSTDADDDDDATSTPTTAPTSTTEATSTSIPATSTPIPATSTPVPTEVPTESVSSESTTTS